jgi:hypothetical protein
VRGSIVAARRVAQDLQLPRKPFTNDGDIMAKDESQGTNQKLEGEGSYTATRKYNRHLAEHLKKQDVQELAEEAREAVEGEEGEELHAAEEQGKKGPQGRPVERLRESGARRKPDSSSH